MKAADEYTADLPEEVLHILSDLTEEGGAK